MANQAFDIEYVAHLARIELTAEEKERLGGQLNDILDYVEKLSQLDVKSVEPTAHPVALTNATRPDEPGDSLSQSEALENAPKAVNGLFAAPKIVE